jgi:probable rRNA maturation factor
VVEIFFEDTEILDLHPEFFMSWLSKVCETEGKELGDLVLVFCSDEHLLGMNQKHLNHDYYTDIITFDYTDEVVSGDLFISVDRVKDNATKEGGGFNDELHRVVVHGVLHLLGYDDKSDEDKSEMRKNENKALKLIVPRETKNS